VKQRRYAGLGVLGIVMAIAVTLIVRQGRGKPVSTLIAPETTNDKRVTPLTTLEAGTSSTLSSTPVSPDDVSVNREDMPMVEVPAGESVMGSTRDDVAEWGNAWAQYHATNTGLPASEERFVDELPQLTVYLPAFEIDRYEVTVAQYQQCVADNICTPPDSRYTPYDWRDAAYSNYPIVGVRWLDAQNYCQWMRKRLPTEAEWEKAARGEDGRIYPWGNVWEAGYVNLGRGNLQPVNSPPEGASPYGALNMSGNAGEWTADEYAAYPGFSPSMTSTNHERTVRGWATTQWDARAAVRAKQPDLRLVDPTLWIGFRCAQGSEPDPLRELIVAADIPVAITPTANITTNITADMAYILEGEFLMGANLSQEELAATPWRKDEMPAHTVYLSEYYIDRTEVTNARYAQFLNALGEHRWACQGQDCIVVSPCAGCSDSRILHDGNQYVVEAGYENYPVQMVAWYGAQAYCRWLGKRLPTEAEWEKAARGADGRRYPWGNDWQWGDTQAMNLSFFGEVGSHPDDMSIYGVMDMLGNVGERVSDWYAADYYAHSPYRDPQGPESGEGRVVRSHGESGSAIDGLTARHQASTGLLGFRCVYTP